MVEKKSGKIAIVLAGIGAVGTALYFLVIKKPEVGVASAKITGLEVT